MRWNKMKLNPSKCAFGVGSGMFLKFVVFERGIKANPEKVNAILDMPSSRSINDVQKLADPLTTFNCFVSWSTNKCLLALKCCEKLKTGTRSVT